jgi:hypothetical protein
MVVEPHSKLLLAPNAKSRQFEHANRYLSVALRRASQRKLPQFFATSFLESAWKRAEIDGRVPARWNTTWSTARGTFARLRVASMESIWRQSGRRLVISLGLSLVLTASVSASPRAVGAARASPPQTSSSGHTQLSPSNGDQTVYDSNLNVTWLADANLAVSPRPIGIHCVNMDGTRCVINKSGSMDYQTAVQWVKAMNAYHHSAGYLGHNNWQLPTTPLFDKKCSFRHVNSSGVVVLRFGFNCTNSAMGTLYYKTLGLFEPNTAVPIPKNAVGPFQNFQPYLYWSSSSPSGSLPGYSSFSFNTGFQGSNIDQNYLYVLPMINRKLPGTPAATGKALEVNPGGQTIYDPVADVTWLADANLAASRPIGIDCVNKDGTPCVINADGSMTHTTAVQWITAMKAANKGAGYLGQTDWEMPPSKPTGCSSRGKKGLSGFGCIGRKTMGELFYGQLRRLPGESVVATPDVRIGPFHNIQPYLYWSCQGNSSQSPCQSTGPASGFEWSFSFGNGFEGTDVVANNLYVMVYYPNSTPPHPVPTPKCVPPTKCPPPI